MSDLTAYDNLTLYDRDAVDILAAARGAIASRLPGMIWREGTLEAIILEALAHEAAEVTFAINRVPRAVESQLLALFDVPADLGSRATVNITFTVSGTAGATIPAGTTLLVSQGAGLEPVTFALDSDLTIAPGSTTGIRSATATTATARANGIQTGVAVAVQSAVAVVQTAATASTVIGGRDPETLDDYHARARTRLARLTDSLVIADHFVAAALEEAAVVRATAIDLYDGAGGPPYTDVGHTTVVVRGEDANLSAPERAALAASLEARAIAGLRVHVIDPTTVGVDVHVVVARRPGFSAADVAAAVEVAVRAYLDPDVWPWTNTARVNEVIVAADQATVGGVSCVDYVISARLALAGLNGDTATFDNGTGTWTVEANGAVTAEVSPVYAGTRALRIRAAGAGDVIITAATAPAGFAVTPGGQVRIGGRIRAGTAARTVVPSVRYYNGAGVLLIETAGVGVVDSPTAWTELVVEGVAPATAVTAIPVVTIVAAATGEDHFLDSVYGGQLSAGDVHIAGDGPLAQAVGVKVTVLNP